MYFKSQWFRYFYCHAFLLPSSTLLTSLQATFIISITMRPVTRAVARGQGGGGDYPNQGRGEATARAGGRLHVI